MHKHNGNILLIFEHEAQLAELRAQLVPYFNVFTATNSRSAYKVLKEYDMQVVLSAEHIQDMTGIQFVEGVKSEFPDLVTIIRSSSTNTEALRDASRNGKIHQFLRSGAHMDEIIQSLSSAVSQFKLKQDNRAMALELQKTMEEQNRILELFKRYVPEQVVSQTLLSKENEIMQGETRVVSVLFADIRNFTGIAASLNPAEVVAFLNDFWSELSEAVKFNHGSVNKLIGDGMLALFGAPVSHINNHENAVLCGLDMIQALEKVNEKYKLKFGDDIKIGIGINTGEVVVGNIGTADHMEYTVIGDAVNIASKIETKTKLKPNSILISEDTYKYVNDTIDAIMSEPLTLEGKDEAILLYEVAGKKESNVKPIRGEQFGH